MIKYWEYYQPDFEYEKWTTKIDIHSGWVGHKYFIYDLIRNKKPKNIVELGTHYGTSLFSMCQAVKDAKLKTKVFAVDLWEGDEQAGYYSNEVFEQVKNIIDKYYKSVDIELLKMDFNEAAINFDSEIDILHIDGLHTYNAVANDYKTWSPKVKDDGLILLHDTAVDSKGFGVKRFWRKVKRAKDTIEFMHSNGLGVVISDQEEYGIFERTETIWNLYYSLLHENKTLKEQGYMDGEIRELKYEINLNRKLKQELKAINEDIEKQNEQIENIRSSKFYSIWKILGSPPAL